MISYIDIVAIEDVAYCKLRFMGRIKRIRNRNRKNRSSAPMTNKPFVVNIDVLVYAEEETAAEKEAMRVSPLLHRHENMSSLTKVCYVNEQPCCKDCKSLDVTISEQGHKFRCNECGTRWD